MVTAKQKKELIRAAQRNGLAMPAAPQLPAQWADSVDDVEVCSDLLLIEEFLPGETKGGIILPEGASSDGPRRGVVVQAGPGALRDDGSRAPMESKVGDLVYIEFRSNGKVINLGGRKYYLVPDGSVVMKVGKGRQAG